MSHLGGMEWTQLRDGELPKMVEKNQPLITPTVALGCIGLYLYHLLSIEYVKKK